MKRNQNQEYSINTRNCPRICDYQKWLSVYQFLIEMGSLPLIRKPQFYWSPIWATFNQERKHVRKKKGVCLDWSTLSLWVHNKKEVWTAEAVWSILILPIHSNKKIFLPSLWSLPFICCFSTLVCRKKHVDSDKWQ